MRPTLILLLLSMFLSAGTGEAFADRHDKGSPRQEQTGHQGKKNHKGKKEHKGNKKHYGKDKHRPGGRPTHYAPPPPPSHHLRPGTPPPPPPPPPHLPDMVRYATKGCHDVKVWQINNDTYIVKYRKGRKLYTRQLYPYTQRYGDVNLINVNWQPLSPWTLIPSVQLNINL